jgi:hypothetical protein
MNRSILATRAHTHSNDARAPNNRKKLPFITVDDTRPTSDDATMTDAPVEYQKIIYSVT